MQKLTPERARIINRLKRRDINPMEAAELLYDLTGGEDFGQTDAAGLLGYSQPWVANHIRLLNLPPFVIELIRSGALNFSDGKALASLPPNHAESFAKLKIAERWTTKKLEEAIREAGISRRETPGKSGKNPVTARF